MRKFHTVISFLIIIAVTIVILGLLARLKPKTSESSTADAPEQTETTHRMLLCI
jgi:hypothetical protein